MKRGFFFPLFFILTLILAACGGPAAQPPAAEQPTAAPAAAQPTAAPAAQPTAAPEPTAAPAAQPTAAPAATAVGKEFHGAWPYQLPPKGHYNSFVTDFMDFGIYNDMLETPLAIYDWADSKFIPLLATEWKSDGDNYTVKLQSGVKWSDGSDFSSDDVLTTFYLLRVMSNSVWRYIDKVEAPDKTTVTFHFAKPSSVAPRFILKTRIRPNSVYKDLGAKAKALVDKPQDSDENKALREELTKFRPTDFVTSGPVKLDPASITSSRLTLVKSPGGFNADKFPFDAVVLFNGETPDITPVVLSKDVDYATHGFPPATEKSFIDAGIRIIRPATVSGPAIVFNYTNKDLAKPEVRQAIAYAVKRDENGTVSLGDSGKAVKYMTGFSDNMVPTWMSQDAIAKLNTYDYDPSKAEQLLTSAGYKKGADGVWAGPNGPLEFELTAPAEFADWSAAAENLATQLTDFGIKTTFRGVQFQQHTEDVQQGKFVIAIRGWGAGNPHPFFSYEADLLTLNQPVSPGPGMSFPFKQKVDGKDVDLNDLITKTAEGTDESAQKGPITDLATDFNKLLPIVPLWERYGNNASLEGVRVDKFPADDDPIWKNPVYADNPVVVLLLEGKLKPKA
ncbi:MAG TPA: ABC transporter substrate-binding protein [Roseiflexaceae bacterium]|nr:ABC transporter substrate-binding protein [Roseiflexaceae bacterium]